jgi:hypothetical protein
MYQGGLGGITFSFFIRPRYAERVSGPLSCVRPSRRGTGRPAPRLDSRWRGTESVGARDGETGDVLRIASGLMPTACLKERPSTHFMRGGGDAPVEADGANTGVVRNDDIDVLGVATLATATTSRAASPSMGGRKGSHDLAEAPHLTTRKTAERLERRVAEGARRRLRASTEGVIVRYRARCRAC